MESGIRTITSTDISQTTTAKTESYGASAVSADGRRFRYCGAGGSLNAGNLVVAPSLIAGHQNLAITATAANATQITVTLGGASATQDQYAEGTLVVGVAGSGVPVTLKIKGNSAGNASTAITVTLNQGSPVPFALTASNVVSLAPSVYSSVQASSTAAVPIGVATTVIPSGSYGWVQVFGPVGVVNDAAGSLSANGKIKQSTTVAGAVVASTAATDIQVGQVIQATSASAAGLAFVTLD